MPSTNIWGKPVNDKQYDTMNRGALFEVPSTRRTNPKAPSHTGDLTISKEVAEAALRGEPIKLSAWLKTTSRGTLVSLSVNTFKPKAPSEYPKSNKQYPVEVEPRDAGDVPW